MMENKFIGLMVGLTVGVLMVSGFLWPVVSDATATETTFENENYYTMDVMDSETERTITWDKDNLGVITVDGTDIEMASFAGSGQTSFTIIGSDSIIVRYEKTSDVFAGVQLYGTNGAYLSFHSNTAAAAGDSLTITVSGGTVSCVTNGTEPLNRSFNIENDGYIINPDGTGTYAVMKKANIPAYVLNDSEIRLIGISVSGGPNGIAVYGSGTIDDGITLSAVYKPASVTTVTFSDAVATDETVAGYENLYELSKYEFTINYDANSYDATYSYFLVPAEVTAEKSWHLDTMQIAMIGVIGTLGAIVLIAAAAGSIRRLD